MYCRLIDWYWVASGRHVVDTAPTPTTCPSPLRPQLEPQACPLQAADVQDDGDQAHILGQNVNYFLQLSSDPPTALVIHILLGNKLIVIIVYQVYF